MFEARDHLVGGNLFLRLGPAIAEMVGPQHDDYVRDAGLSNDIAIEAAQTAVAPNVVQDPVAAEALVHDSHWPAAAAGLQPAGELAGPPAMGIERRNIRVGQ